MFWKLMHYLACEAFYTSGRGSAFGEEPRMCRETLAHKVTIVSGGASGNGRTTAEQMVASGARVGLR